MRDGTSLLVQGLQTAAVTIDESSSALTRACRLIMQSVSADYVAFFALTGARQPSLIGSSCDPEQHRAEVAAASRHIADEVAAQRTGIGSFNVIRCSVPCEDGQSIIAVIDGVTGPDTMVAVAGRIAREFSHADDRLARRMAGVFALQLRQAMEIDDHHREAEGFAAALDIIPDGIVLLDREGGIAATNVSARLLIARNDGLRLFGKRLTAVGLDDAVRLQTAIDHCLQPFDATIDTCEGTIVSVRRRVERPLIVAVLRLGAVEGRDIPGVVLRIVDPIVDAGSIASVCTLYGLSGAERRLVQVLITGASLSEAAAELHIQLPTARSYLQQVFAKTGVNRQAALVHLLMSSMLQVPGHIRLAVI